MRSPARIALLLTVLVTVLTLLHGYAWQRLVRDPAWPSPFFELATAGIALMAIALLATRVLLPRAPRALAVPAGWLSFFWLGVVFYLDVVFLALDLGRVGFEAVAHATGMAQVTHGEGVGTARAVAAAASLVTLGIVASGVVRARGAATVRNVVVPIDGLPTALRGLRIAQLTDVHVGPTIRRAFVERLVERVNALSADLVVITGDLVDGPVSELASEVAPLAGLRARHGVFFVTGNHELFSGVEPWVAFVRTLGIRVLRNEHVRIAHEDAHLTLAGIDDFLSPSFGGRSDLTAALAGRVPEDKVVLLAHQPRGIEAAATAGVALQLSGHTHGGQMAPFGALVRLQQPFLRGLHRVGATWLWISEGTGYWGPPLRVGTRSEISVLELR